MKSSPLLLLLMCVGSACSSTPASPDAATDLGSIDRSSIDRASVDSRRIDAARADRGASDGAPGCPAFAAGAKTGAVASAEVTEASGLIASRKNPGVLWAHNDSGDTARVFALTTQGAHLGIYALEGATANDWEDMASGPGPTAGAQYLYLGDIGDNKRARANVTVYRVLEPTVNVTQPPATVTLSGVEALVLVYPDGAQNAETLLIDPQNGDLAIVSKDPSGTSGVYWSPAPQDAQKPRTLTKVMTLEFGSGALAFTDKNTTGGDVSPDGAELIVRGYPGAALFRRAPGTPLWQAFAAAPCQVPIVFEPQGETVAYDAEGKGYYTLSEGALQPIYHFARK